MLSKPSACRSCGLYGDGKGWVPDRLVKGCRVALVAQNPGADEEKGQRIIGYAGPRQPVYEACEPQPLVGQTGWDVEHTFLPRTGLTRDQVSMMNVLKCRLLVNGRRTNDLPSGKTLDEAVNHCMTNHFVLPSHVRLVVAMGALAVRALSGKAYPVSEWRGFILPEAA